jgi:hypothetical protein
MVFSNTIDMPAWHTPASGRRLHHVGVVVRDVESAAPEYLRRLALDNCTLPFQDTFQKVRVCLSAPETGCLSS